MIRSIDGSASTMLCSPTVAYVCFIGQISSTPEMPCSTSLSDLHVLPLLAQERDHMTGEVERLKVEEAEAALEKKRQAEALMQEVHRSNAEQVELQGYDS